MSLQEHRKEKANYWAAKMGLTHDHIFGLRFAFNVALATCIVWYTLRLIGAHNPIWAIASMIAASDPEPGEAKRMFKARLTNVLVGCAIGLIFLIIGGANEWILPLALAVAVIISSFIIRVKTMWRQAPITAAIVIASGSINSSALEGIEQGLYKVAEVIFGCLVGMLVSILMSKFWILELPKEATGFVKKKK